MSHHQIHRGGSTRTLAYSIAQNAWFVKAGAIIPMAEEGIQNLQDKSDNYRIFIAPGKGKSSCNLYEDDGTSQAYDTDYAITKISKNATSSSLNVTISPREGHYEGMSQERQFTIIIGGLLKKPSSAVSNGTVLDIEYNAEYREAVVCLPAHSSNQVVSMVVKY